MESDIILKSQQDADIAFVNSSEGKAVLIVLTIFTLFCLCLAFYNSYLIIKKDYIKC
jgi:hypothetical protein